jgi:hypothetical protein
LFPEVVGVLDELRVVHKSLGGLDSVAGLDEARFKFEEKLKIAVNVHSKVTDMIVFLDQLVGHQLG